MYTHIHTRKVLYMYTDPFDIKPALCSRYFLNTLALLLKVRFLSLIKLGNRFDGKCYANKKSKSTLKLFYFLWKTEWPIIPKIELICKSSRLKPQNRTYLEITHFQLLICSDGTWKLMSLLILFKSSFFRMDKSTKW